MPTAQTLNYLDFVDLPDHHFVTLFINDRKRERSYDRNVLILLRLHFVGLLKIYESFLILGRAKSEHKSKDMPIISLTSLRLLATLIQNSLAFIMNKLQMTLRMLWPWSPQKKPHR
jgi:hypothetical protein